MNKKLNTLVLMHLNKNLCIEIYDDYYQAIRENSHKCILVDYRHEYLNRGKQAFEAYALNLIEEHQIDIVFFIPYSEDLTLDIFFLELISQKTTLVMNFFDSEYFFEDCDRYYAQVADLVIVPDSQAIGLYKLYNIPVKCTFSLFDISKYVRRRNTVKDIDVLFIGDINKSGRVAYVDYLAKQGINVECFGKNTHHGIIEFSKMIDLMNRSKIALNFASYDHKAFLSRNINQRIKQSKGRPIEIALCGGFCLSELTCGINDMFTIGTEIDVFNNEEELLQKIKYYLNNPSIREEMARKAYERASKEYCSYTTFKVLMENLSVQTTKRSKQIFLDTSFKENYFAFRYYYIVLALLTRNPKTFLNEIGVLLKNPRFYYKGAFYYTYKAGLEYLNRFPDFKQRLKKIYKKIYN